MIQNSQKVDLNIMTVNPNKSFTRQAYTNTKYRQILDEAVKSGEFICKQENYTNGAIYDIRKNVLLQGEELENTIDQIHVLIPKNQVVYDLMLLKEGVEMQTVEKQIEIEKEEKKRKAEQEKEQAKQNQQKPQLQPLVNSFTPPISDESGPIQDIPKTDYHFIMKDGQIIQQEFTLALASNITVSELNDCVYKYLSYSDRNVVEIDLYYRNMPLKPNKTVSEQFTEGQIEVRLRWIGGSK